MEKDIKITLKWILYWILLTFTCVLIFFCLPWIAEKIGGNLGIKNGTEAIFVMMLLFNWCFGMTLGFKLFCEELDKFESEKQKEIEEKTSQKEDVKIEK